MTKKTTTKLGGIGGLGDQHLETRELKITEYQRLRMERIKENMSKMQELGLKEKAMSLMARVQNSRSNFSKHKMNKVSAEDGLYRPKQDSDMEHESDSSNEELLLPHSKINLKSKTIPWKIRKMKALTRKAVTVALAFQKCEKDKPRRGLTKCYNVHGCNEEERLEITLNEHGQTVGPDDKTCNEFTSFFGTIARKPNILPLTVKNWPILRNKKKEELWDYVSKHYIVAVMKEVEKKHAKEVEAMQKKIRG
uniref:Uncharacterized protein n=1 Tax=Chenopodium quinoa TaxID=63459 RepID=A0A803KSU2_CHEQI